MPGCSALGCKNRKTKGIKTHHFPKDIVRRTEWAIKVGRKTADNQLWIPMPTSVLCQEHFDISQYETKRDRVLRWNAVPTIFKKPDSSSKNPQTYKQPYRTRRSAKNQEVITTEEEDVDSPDCPPSSTSGDITGMPTGEILTPDLIVRKSKTTVPAPKSKALRSTTKNTRKYTKRGSSPVKEACLPVDDSASSDMSLTPSKRKRGSSPVKVACLPINDSASTEKILPQKKKSLRRKSPLSVNDATLSLEKAPEEPKSPQTTKKAPGRISRVSTKDTTHPGGRSTQKKKLAQITKNSQRKKPPLSVNKGKQSEDPKSPQTTEKVTKKVITRKKIALSPINGNTYEDIVKENSLILAERKIKLLENNVWSLQSQAEHLKKSLLRIFSPDQLEHLTGPMSARQWSINTIKEAFLLRLVIGERGYEYLHRKGYPIPTTATLKKRLKDLDVQKIKSQSMYDPEVIVKLSGVGSAQDDCDESVYSIDADPVEDYDEDVDSIDAEPTQNKSFGSCDTVAPSSSTGFALDKKYTMDVHDIIHTVNPSGTTFVNNSIETVVKTEKNCVGNSDKIVDLIDIVILEESQQSHTNIVQNSDEPVVITNSNLVQNSDQIVGLYDFEILQVSKQDDSEAVNPVDSGSHEPVVKTGTICAQNNDQTVGLYNVEVLEGADQEDSESVNSFDSDSHEPVVETDTICVQNSDQTVCLYNVEFLEESGSEDSESVNYFDSDIQNEDESLQKPDTSENNVDDLCGMDWEISFEQDVMCEIDKAQNSAPVWEAALAVLNKI